MGCETLEILQESTFTYTNRVQVYFSWPADPQVAPEQQVVNPYYRLSSRSISLKERENLVGLLQICHPGDYFQQETLLELEKKTSYWNASSKSYGL